MIGLIRLHLSGNKLKSFIYNDECLSSLELLDLSNNHITSMPMQMWLDFPSLTAVDISTNPLYCDCALTSFVSKIADSGFTPLNKVNFFEEEVRLFIRFLK